MDRTHLTELVALEDTYWWHTAKRQLAIMLLKKYIRPPGLLAEGGIGSSRNLREFQSLGYDVVGFDILPEAVEHAKHLELNRTFLHDICLPWPLDDESLRAVVLLDVIEHLRDPIMALTQAHTCLKTDGGVIITVPAYQSLYGPWDQNLGHHRRYSASLLRHQATEAGFSIRWMQHWNSFSLPPALLIRLYERLRTRDTSPRFPRVPFALNLLLQGLATLERHTLRLGIPVPAGLSLVAVLIKT